MKALEQFLNRLIKELGYEKRLEYQRLLDSWPQVVGERIADVSRAERVQNGVMVVKVDSPVWRNELALEKERILKLLQEKTGSKALVDIRFV